MSDAIGIDVGGTSVRAAIVSAAGEISRDLKEPLDGKSPEALLDQMTRLVSELGPGRNDLPVGIGLAAQLWVREGKVAVAPNLGWHDLPFGAMVRERFGRPVRLVNDLNAIAAGEALAGAGRGASDMVCAFLGTGLGMGAVVGGRLLEGADGLATELGHIKIASVNDGRLCGCGQRGCLEAYTSGHHLPGLLGDAVTAGHATTLGDALASDPPAIDAGVLEKAAARGDEAAALVWSEIGERMGRALGNLVAVLNPRVLVLGGGVLFSAPSLRRLVGEQIPRYAPVAHASVLDVRDAELGDRAGLIGAALLALGKL